MHPPNSPNLSPSDFHLFTSPHEHFVGKRFGTTEEIKAAVVEYFQNLDAEYCHAGLQKLHKRYTKCLDLQGDYVKKIENFMANLTVFFFQFFWTNSWQEKKKG